jgi:hypothetical protein
MYLKDEEFCLLGYNALQSGESQTTFLRNISPPYSRSKNRPSKKRELKEAISRQHGIISQIRHIRIHRSESIKSRNLISFFFISFSILEDPSFPF